MRKKRDRREFLRGWIETDEAGKQAVQRFEREGSHILSSMTAATGLVEIAEAVTAVAPGDRVTFPAPPLISSIAGTAPVPAAKAPGEKLKEDVDDILGRISKMDLGGDKPKTPPPPGSKGP